MAAPHDPPGLTPEQARRVYDRIGRFQDWQRFYETAPIKDLIDHSRFEDASAVFEVGCGTGAFAERLLAHHLGSDAAYTAVDVSEKMVQLSRDRLAPWQDRCRVSLVDGRAPLPGDDHRFDRFVATYVFDLLDDEAARAMLEEALRLLTPGGRLCTVGLTEGVTPASRALIGGWKWVWARAPRLVGGCRPVALGPLLSQGWTIVHQPTVTAWAVPSEVIVATPLPG